ncbi:hypothetical protein O0L34_g16658 [Tuta absoluta]|nr:hypothetical protein O0L34_g16658 [Tuta absoluta]
MFALCFLACLALASAAPHSSQFEYDRFLRIGIGNNSPNPPLSCWPGSSRAYMNLFKNLFPEYATEKIEQGLNKSQAHYPSTTTKVDDVVTKSLHGYKEEDIKVKAGKAFEMAVKDFEHKAGKGVMMKAVENTDGGY